MQPLGLEVGIYMCGGHHLKFLNCHISNEEGGEMTVNLPHRRTISKIKINQAQQDV